jgi:mercury(II) reductase
MTDKTHDCCSSKGTNGDHKNDYDIAVIGAGSAGFSAAITAADSGARVALIGSGTIGGTCVNIGCVPSKTMIRAAETLYHAREAGRFDGIAAKAGITDWKAIMAQKQALVDELRGAKYEALLPQYEGVSYIEGKARLVEGGVFVNGAFIEAPKIIIATGSSPSLPPIEGMSEVPYLTSTTALELDHLPASMIVIGGGVIGVELGQMFARMGTNVTLLCRSRLLPSEEPEISAALETYLKKEGIEVVCGAAYKSIKSDNGISLAYEVEGTGTVVDAEQVLVATGRSPNSRELGLEELGIEIHANGGIKIDDRMLTNRDNVYAVGDVTGRDMFVYMAAYGAKIATKNAMNSNSFSYDNTAMPSVVFTDPQVASVGLTQAMAEVRGIATKTSILTLDNVPRALAARDTRGLIKLVAEKETGRLIGAHIIAPEGADSIQTAAIAIQQGMTYQELGDMIFPYLTTVEGLKLAAQTFDKDVAKLSCCAG